MSTVNRRSHPGIRFLGAFVLVSALVPALEACHGHHAGHRFGDAEHWAQKFEDPARDIWQKPEVVLTTLELEPHHTVADIGSATGYFPVRIAHHVPRGRVWGVDIEPDMVRHLNDRARREGLTNLVSILGTADDPLLPEQVDRVLLVDTYHHVENRTHYFEDLRRSLRPDAWIVIVDFLMGDFPVGPPDSMKIEPVAVEAELDAAGYSLIRRDEISLPYQYILVFESSETGIEDNDVPRSGPSVPR